MEFLVLMFCVCWLMVEPVCWIARKAQPLMEQIFFWEEEDDEDA